MSDKHGGETAPPAEGRRQLALNSLFLSPSHRRLSADKKSTKKARTFDVEALFSESRQIAQERNREALEGREGEEAETRRRLQETMRISLPGPSNRHSVSVFAFRTLEMALLSSPSSPGFLYSVGCVSPSTITLL